MKKIIPLLLLLLHSAIGEYSLQAQYTKEEARKDLLQLKESVILVRLKTN